MIDRDIENGFIRARERSRQEHFKANWGYLPIIGFGILVVLVIVLRCLGIG